MLEGFRNVIIPLMVYLLAPLVAIAFMAPPVLWLLGKWGSWWLH